MKPGASKKAVFGIITFFLVGGLGFLAGAAFAWSDEHSGTSGTRACGVTATSCRCASTAPIT